MSSFTRFIYSLIQKYRMSFFSFNINSLEKHIGSGTLTRGKSVFNRGKVVYCECQKSKDFDGWIIKGKVFGSNNETYRTRTELELSASGDVRSFDGSCSCPVTIDCKHSIALALYVNQQSKKQTPFESVLNLTHSSQTHSSLKPKQQASLTEVENWLQNFQGDSEANALGDFFDETSKKSADDEEQVVFFIQSDEKLPQRLLVGYGLSRKYKRGKTWSKVQLGKNVTEVMSRNVPEHKLELVKLVRSMPSSSDISFYMSDVTILSGSFASALLEKAAQEQHLFWSNNSIFSRSVRLEDTLFFSPSIEIQWKWKEIFLSNQLEPSWQLLVDLEKIEESLNQLNLNKINLNKNQVDAIFLDDQNQNFNPDFNQPNNDFNSKESKSIKDIPHETHQNDSDNLDHQKSSIQIFFNSPPFYVNLKTKQIGELISSHIHKDKLNHLLNAPPIPNSAFIQHQAALLKQLSGIPFPAAVKPPQKLNLKPKPKLCVLPVSVEKVTQYGFFRVILRFDYAGELFFWRNQQTPILIESILSASELENRSNHQHNNENNDGNNDENPSKNNQQNNQQNSLDLINQFMKTLNDDEEDQRFFSELKEPKNKDNKNRIQLFRDLAIEKEALSAWSVLGLGISEQGLAYLPYLSLSQQQQFWLPLMDQRFESLRKAGWEIVFHPQLDSWIEYADAFQIEIKDPNHPSYFEPKKEQKIDDEIDNFLSQAQNAKTTENDEGNEETESHAISPWFNLSLGIEINGERHNVLPWLPSLLEQIRAESRQKETIQDDGTIVFETVLPEHVFVPKPKPQMGYLRLPTKPLKPWLVALIELVNDRNRHAFEDDNLQLSRLEALRLGASLGEGAMWDGALALQKILQQLRGQQSLPEIEPPKELIAQLRPYQLQGLNWLQFLREHHLAGILADDMGLGKTLQTLAHILVEKLQGRLKQPALIVAPVSLLGNWKREAQRFTPTLKSLVFHGQDRHENTEEMTEYDLVITSYSLLPRERKRWLDQLWHVVVLDEAQNIKNAKTHAAQVVRELNATHKLCLSGTPMENHLGELWSLFHFLMPGFLGSQARFKEQFRIPIEQHASSERLRQLRQRITPFILRRQKKDVATELPDKIESISSVQLIGKQADLYETIRLTMEQSVRDALKHQGLARSQIQILDALLKLRQVCCDPRLVPTESAKKIKQSAKLEQLMEMLPELLNEGRRVLLFSQFTSMLELIEEELPKFGIRWVKLTGQSVQRDKIIDRFTNGEVPLFLISLKAGGVGLNLPQADTVIHYDPWWNPAVENQATDRAHRIGQKNQVFVYKMVAQGTIEERILALQERKAALAESIYTDALERKQPFFTEDDIAELLKPLAIL